MAAKIIDGKAIARMVNEETLARVEKLKAAGKTPGLAVVFRPGLTSRTAVLYYIRIS